jgi:hypothetical protein
MNSKRSFSVICAGEQPLVILHCVNVYNVILLDPACAVIEIALCLAESLQKDPKLLGQREVSVGVGKISIARAADKLLAAGGAIVDTALASGGTCKTELASSVAGAIVAAIIRGNVYVSAPGGQIVIALEEVLVIVVKIFPVLLYSDSEVLVARILDVDQRKRQKSAGSGDGGIDRRSVAVGVGVFFFIVKMIEAVLRVELEH